MRGTKGIVRRFTAFRKTRNAALLTQVSHRFTATRQNFVRVGLVADIPDDSVMRCIKHIVQGQRELDCAQIG